MRAGRREAQWVKVIHVRQRGCERYKGKVNFDSGMDKLETLSGKIQSFFLENNSMSDTCKESVETGYEEQEK